MSNTYKKQKIPQKVRIEVWKKYNGDSFTGTCYSCKDSLKFENFHAGHIVSESNGGETKAINLAPICASCNLSCATKNLEEFKEYLKIYKRILLEKSFGLTVKTASKKLKKIPLYIKNNMKEKSFFIKYEGILYDIEIEEYEETLCCINKKFSLVSVYIWSA